MKTTLLTALLFLSIGVMAQEKSIPSHIEWAGNVYNVYAGYHRQSDTLAVYMLVSHKTKYEYPIQLFQLEGYSVTPRISYNGLLNITYLDKDKKPLLENVIVWMAVKR